METKHPPPLQGQWVLKQEMERGGWTFDLGSLTSHTSPTPSEISERDKPFALLYTIYYVYLASQKTAN